MARDKAVKSDLNEPLESHDHRKREVDRSQIDRFRDIARQIGCDEDEAAFDKKLKKFAQSKTNN